MKKALCLQETNCTVLKLYSGSGAWHTLLVICQAVSGQGVPDVSLSSGTWLAASCPRRPLDAALLKVRWTHLERADWHGHALLAREQAGVPVPFPSSSLLMPNEVQQALTDILSAFPLSLASLSFSLSLAPARSLAFFFPSPSLIHGTGSTPSTDVWKRREDTEVTVGGFESGQRG